MNKKYNDTAAKRMRAKRDPLLRKKTQNRMRIAARIEDIMNELNLSKSAFAKLVDQSPSVITKWLSGTHNFTQDTYTLIEFKTTKKVISIEPKEDNVSIQINIVYKQKEDFVGNIFPIDTMFRQIPNLFQKQNENKSFIQIPSC